MKIGNKIYAIIGMLFLIPVSAKATDLDKFSEGARLIIKKHIPEANIDKNDDRVIGKFRTMKFQIHHSKLGGQYQSDPEPVEGPNRKGFKIHLIPIHGGIYRGDDAIPRSFKSMYWNTYMSVIVGKDKQRYLLYFEYGYGLNEEFKKKMFSLMNQLSEQGNADQSKKANKSQ